MPTLSPIQIPPFKYAQDFWDEQSCEEKGLLFMAQECDVYHTAEVPPGSNKGPRVSAILRDAQSVPGEPWCAALCFECYVLLAGCKMGRVIPYPASVASWLTTAQLTGRWHDADSGFVPKRGHLFVIHQNGVSHMGAVSNDHGDGTFSSIEGNSNAGGSSEGWEVVRRTRSIDRVTGFIDMGEAA